MVTGVIVVVLMIMVLLMEGITEVINFGNS